MRTWNLAAGDPLCLNLAADARLGKVDYANDHIWKVAWQNGAPAAVAIETTFGLRARSFRIFPRFSEADRTYTDPTEFASPPTVYQAFPNYIALQFTPIPSIDVNYELWVPSSQSLAGRLTFTNSSAEDHSVRLDMTAQLTPNEGQRMASLELEAATVLSGISSDLSPIVFMTGGSRPGSGSFPSLRQDIHLHPGESKSVVWTEAALPSPITSFAEARQLASRNWDAEIARVELANAGTLELYTGSAEWDATFKWAQKQALGLIMSEGPGLPHPSIVLSRQPDQGYSPRGDGSDYSHHWNGQSPLEVLHMSDLILHSAPEIVKGLVRNFLAVQAEDGSIDLKPGLANQRSRIQATPVLASLTWRIYQSTADRKFLGEVYPGLVKFIHSWFTPEHDLDQDGVPEWDHPIQSGYEDHPLYANWHGWSQGIDISSAESPSLIAFLLRELEALQRIAAELNQNGSASEFENYATGLEQALQECWDEQQGIFIERDRDAHTSDAPQWLGDQTGPGSIFIQPDFSQKMRLVIKIKTSDASSRHPRVVIHGTSISGMRRVEEISEERFKWLLGIGILTGERIYQSIEQVDIQNIAPDDQVSLHTAGYQCNTLPQMLPLWTGQLTEATTEQLVSNSITNPERFWHRFGLPGCVDTPIFSGMEICTSCDPMWNTLIAEGLLVSGYPQAAAELFDRFMNATILSLKTNAEFRRYYHADTGQGMGEPNSLNGLPPLGLFLRILGVQIVSSTRVEIFGENPFPWPVTIKYRGLTILRGKEKTTIIFPDGQTVESNELTPQVISLEMP